MNVSMLNVYPDGSSWVAVVVVKGIMFSASFVAGKVSVGVVSQKRRTVAPAWTQKYICEWAQKEVAALPKEWHEAHKALYSI